MREKLQDHIEKEVGFFKEKKLLLACSGGVDSVVLVHLMHSLNYDIAIAHCNFSLRGRESDDDEIFVIDLARHLNIPVFVETFDTKAVAKDLGQSTQMAARFLRYKWFSEVLTNFKYDFLLTAHHLDDDLETFFINLSRGTGIRGLTGIPSTNEKIVRPLLPFSREQIEEYAHNNNLEWREDSSNKNEDYLRNKLRLNIIPAYKEATPSLLKNFKKTQQYLKNSAELIDDYMVLVYKLVVTQGEDNYLINIEKLKQLPHTQTLLYELLNSFGFSEWNDINDLLEAQSGKQVFSATHKLLKDRDNLILTEIKTKETDNDKEYAVTVEGISQPIHLEFQEVTAIGKADKNTIYLDAQKIQFPLILRKWHEGDSFVPFGMKGRKKISKFFKDEKVSLDQKNKIWLLLSNKKIVWVVGRRMSDDFKITPSTTNVLKITASEDIKSKNPD